MKFLARLFILTTLGLFSLNSYAWWSLGHMVVANIAYQHLTPNVKNKVDKLVTCFKTEYPSIKSFEQMAVWADNLHLEQRIYLTYNWHFIDIPFESDGTPRKNKIHSDNVAWAIEKIVRSFDDKQIASPYEEARLLAFLIHLVGDIHQPLHTVTRITADRPEGDCGGNKFSVKYNGMSMNLHQVWDSGFDTFDGDQSLDHVKEIAKQLSAKYPMNSFSSPKLNNLDPESWLREGMDNAKKYVYDTPEYKSLSKDYVNNGRRTAEREATLAGYRLAIMLNMLLS